MPNQTFKRWSADDIAKLKNLAQKQRREDIAAELGRSLSATSVKATRGVAKSALESCDGSGQDGLNGDPSPHGNFKTNSTTHSR
jgi:hypothetical protein